MIETRTWKHCYLLALTGVQWGVTIQNMTLGKRRKSASDNIFVNPKKVSHVFHVWFQNIARFIYTTVKCALDINGCQLTFVHGPIAEYVNSHLTLLSNLVVMH